jgi:hypothetical protein
MIERQPSWRGPRPPTMIESGRAGIGRTMVTGDSPYVAFPPFFAPSVPELIEPSGIRCLLDL